MEDEHLTVKEKKIYGMNRFPVGYKKLNILGKGGAALVYLGVEKESGKEYAMK